MGQRRLPVRQEAVNSDRRRKPSPDARAVLKPSPEDRVQMVSRRLASKMGTTATRVVDRHKRPNLRVHADDDHDGGSQPVVLDQPTLKRSQQREANQSASRRSRTIKESELDHGSGQSKKNGIAQNGSSSSGSVSTKLPVSSIRTC